MYVSTYHLLVYLHDPAYVKEFRLYASYLFFLLLYSSFLINLNFVDVEHVYYNTGPVRKLLHENWFISCADYGFNNWPDHALGGTYILGRKALLVMQFASSFVQYIFIDDPWIGNFIRRRLNMYCESRSDHTT